ncbi:HNH endonuclease [Mycobacterium dioxanotrophicus]|uniref:HNH endonuclease n=1 Tax=Mycobacterium dioxanotrophicus TaxID=482462 RepID=A0A1Y0C1M9_9MYCO|nr:HNH endonuclease [Mycobacterium dioxanotrophicus]
MSRRQTGFPPLVRTLIYERSAGRCERCDEWASDCEIHHRRPRGAGSTRRPETNYASNGVLLCAECHRHVESYRAKAFDDGWLVRQSHDPKARRVFRREQWVFLDDEGGWRPAPEPVEGRAS